MGLTVLPLSIKNIVQCDHILDLVHGTRSHSSQFLHVRSYTKQESHVHAERPDICAGLAADPEDTEVAVIVKLNELGLVDGSDTELSLDGGNQRRSLEQGAGEQLEDSCKLCLAARDLIVKSHYRHVLLSGTLLGLDESRGSVNANNKTARDFGIEGTAVAGLVHTEHSLYPGNNFVRGWVGGFIELRKVPVSTLKDSSHQESFSH